MKNPQANGTGWRSLHKKEKCTHIMNGVVVNEGTEGQSSHRTNFDTFGRRGRSFTGKLSWKRIVNVVKLI